MLELWHLYMGCLIVGGGLVGLSFLTDADNDMDADVDVDVDIDMDVDADTDASLDVHDANLGGSVSAADALWLPLLSLRFWIFFVFFFGLMGMLLHFTATGFGAMPVLGISIGVGFVCGWTGSTVVTKLRSQRVDGNIDPETDYQGKTGEVLLEVEPGEPGQVRLNVKGVDVDLIAETEGSEVIKKGARVLVTDYRNGRLVVAAQAAT